MPDSMMLKLNAWMWDKPWRYGLAKFFANPFMWLVSLSALAMILLNETFRSFFLDRLLVIMLALIISRVVLTELIRVIYRRRRPYEMLSVQRLYTPIGRHAFPSGHAAFFAALGFALLPISSFAGLMVLSLMVLCGLARVLGGMHWPSDIVGGYFVGFAGWWLAVQIVALI